MGSKAQYDAMFKAVASIVNQVLRDKVHPNGKFNTKANCTGVGLIHKRGSPMELDCTCVNVDQDTMKMRNRLEEALPGVTFMNYKDPFDNVQKFMIRWPLESYKQCLITRVNETEDGKIVYLYKDRIVYQSVMSLYVREFKKWGVFAFLCLLCVIGMVMTAIACSSKDRSMSLAALSVVFQNAPLTFVGFPVCAAVIFAYIVVKESY